MGGKENITLNIQSDVGYGWREHREQVRRRLTKKGKEEEKEWRKTKEREQKPHAPPWCATLPLPRRVACHI
jgi:hypothetical protein